MSVALRHRTTDPSRRIARDPFMLAWDTFFPGRGDAMPGGNPQLLRLVGELARAQGLVSSKVPTPLQAPRVFERALLLGLGDGEGSSVAYNLRALKRCAQGLRERLSPEHWQLIDQVDSEFEHGRHDLGVDPLARLCACRNAARQIGIHQRVEEGSRHLRTARVVDTCEDHRVHAVSLLRGD